MSRSGFVLRNKSVLLIFVIVSMLCLTSGASSLVHGGADGQVNLTREVLALNETIQERAQMNSIPTQEQVIEPISPAMTVEPALAPTVMPFLNRIDPRTHERVYTSPVLPDGLSNAAVSEQLTPSADSGEIYVFVTKWGSDTLGDGNFKYLRGVAVDSSGNVYVADTDNNRIQKFSSTGTFLAKWGFYGTGDGQFAYPEGVAVDSSGNVYVADEGNNRIQKFSSSGTFLAKWGSYGTEDGQFQYPQGVAVDTSGNVFVTDLGNYRIQKFSSSGTFLAKWGTQGSGDGQFYYPGGVAVDSSGNVYVADTNNDRIQKFSSSGTFLAKWGTQGSGDGQFQYPNGVAVDSLGNVYVADINNNRIQKFSSSGTFLAKWGSQQGSGDEQFFLPFSVTVDSSGNVYVADTYNHRIKKLSPIGTFLAKWGAGYTGDGQFYNPEGVAVDSSGNVYVADTDNKRIQKFSSTGTFLAKWGTGGSGDGQFSYPDGVAEDSVGNIYVADEGNNRIQKFSSTGTFLAKWGTRGSGDGQFSYPVGVAVDSSGNVYVADLSNNRIQKFSSSGTFLAKWGSQQGSGDGQFNYPRGVAVDSSGNVYVADSNNHRIQKFSSSGTFLAKWGIGGTGDGQFSNLHGVAVDSSGYVFVSDPGNYRIQKFAPFTAAPPVINFTATPTSGTAPLTVTFTDHSTNVLSGVSAYNQQDYGSGFTTKVSPGISVVSEGNQNWKNSGVMVTPTMEVLLTNPSDEMKPLIPALDDTGTSCPTCENSGDFPLMHFTEEQLDEMQDHIERAPQYSAFNPNLPSSQSLSVGSSKNLLPYLTYSAAERNQGRCGNCWVWASTGALEIDHTVKTGINDRLSIQYFNSKYNSGQGNHWACCGGWLNTFTNWYNTDKTPIPWSNTNANFGDRNSPCENYATAVPIGTISTQPRYSLNSISSSTIQTYNGVGQATAINNIKSALNANRAVVYSFFYGNSGWNDFGTFWSYSNETVVFDPTSHSGETQTGGHAVLIVGYDDTDPNNQYWIVLNSWGNPSNRPHGLFRLKMNINYDAVYRSGIGNYQQHTFELVNSNFAETPRSWNWSFGDGSTVNATMQHPVHTYTHPGNYTVSLTVTNGTGSNTLVRANYITVSPSNKETYQFVTKWGSSGSGDGQFNKPFGIAVDSTGNTYIADMMNNRIQKFNSSGIFSTKWGSSGSDDGQFTLPFGVSVDSSGNIYVADTYNHRIQKFSSTGNFLTKWGSEGSGEGQFFYPYGVSIDLSGNIYIADTSNNRIQKFSSTGNFLTKWGSEGSGNTQFSRPHGVLTDLSGNVYVADTENHRIQKFSSTGTFLTKWGTYGNGAGQFIFPSGVAADSAGNIYVSDSWNHRIQKFNSEGTFLTTWGSGGTGNGEFSYPSSVAVDSSANIYVVDKDNYRIQKFASNLPLSPIANFTANITSGTAPLTIQFTDTSTGAPTAWNWSFWDGGISTQQHPAHTYISAGNYTVSLTVTNGTGSNTLVRANYISVIPPSNNTLTIVPGNAKVAVGLTTNFTIVLDTSLQGLSGYNITLASSNASIAEIVRVTYPAWASMPKNSTIPADRAWFKAVDLDGTSGTQNITFFTVSLRGDAAGITTLTITPEKVEDREGGRYTPSVLSATLTVTAVKPFPKPSGGFFPEPTDPNHDGKYEDIDGNGWIGFNDVVVLYQNMEAADAGVFGPVACYDYDNSGFIGFNDVVKLYGMT